MMSLVTASMLNENLFKVNKSEDGFILPYH